MKQNNEPKGSLKNSPVDELLQKHIAACQMLIGRSDSESLKKMLFRGLLYDTIRNVTTDSKIKNLINNG